MAADVKVGSLVPPKKNRIPIVIKVTDGVKVEDRDGYYRIVKSYAEATLLVQQLLQYSNSVMLMNGFESAKWRLPNGE